MTNRESFEAFLTKEVPGHARDLMIDLKPFFARADTGNYPLASADDALKEEAVSLLTSLFSRKRVKKVVLVSQRSLCEKFEQPEWMTDEVYRDNLNNLWESLRESLGESLRESLWESLGDKLWKSFGESFGERLWKSLGKNLWKSFGGSPWKSLGGSFGKSFGKSFIDPLWYNIEVIFFCYIGFTITGNTEMAEKLKRLMLFQLQEIILGEKKGEPGTWLILCQ